MLFGIELFFGMQKRLEVYLVEKMSCSTTTAAGFYSRPSRAKQMPIVLMRLFIQSFRSEWAARGCISNRQTWPISGSHGDDPIKAHFTYRCDVSDWAGVRLASAGQLKVAAVTLALPTPPLQVGLKLYALPLTGWCWLISSPRALNLRQSSDRAFPLCTRQASEQLRESALVALSYTSAFIKGKFMHLSIKFNSENMCSGVLLIIIQKV